MHDLGMRKRAGSELNRDAGDATEDFIDGEDLLGNSIRAADEQRACGASCGVELRAGYGRPSAFLADSAEDVRISWEEVIGGLRGGVGKETDRMYADGELLWGVPCAAACLTIEINEWAKALGLAANDGNCERKTECTGAGKGLGCSADSDPHRQRVLHRARIDALPCERGTVFSRPVNADVLANVKQEVELFRKELVVVVQVEAEKRIGFDKRAAAYGDFSTSLRDQSTVAKSWKTRTGSAELRTVTALVRRMRLVRAAAAARRMAGAEETYSWR